MPLLTVLLSATSRIGESQAESRSVKSACIVTGGVSVRLVSGDTAYRSWQAVPRKGCSSGDWGFGACKRVGAQHRAVVWI